MLFEQWQRELGFGFYRNGAFVLAFDEGERTVLEELLNRAKANGVKLEATAKKAPAKATAEKPATKATTKKAVAKKTPAKATAE